MQAEVRAIMAQYMPLGAEDAPPKYNIGGGEMASMRDSDGV